MSHSNNSFSPILKVGNIIQIKKGLKLYSLIPEMFVNKEHPYSLNEIWAPITVGDIYTRNISKETLNKNISKALYGQLTPYNSKITEFINSLIASKDLDLSIKTFDSSALIGQYKIINVCQYCNTDYECNEITCVKVDNNSVKIMFYQNLSENHFRDWSFYNGKEIEDIEIIE